jgi:hypothetical protein
VAEKSGVSGVLPIDMAAANRLPRTLMRVVTRFVYALKEIGKGRMGAADPSKPIADSPFTAQLRPFKQN